MKVALHSLLLYLLISCGSPDRFDKLFSGQMKMIDLTHALSKESPYWSNDKGNPFRYDTLFAQPSGAPGMGAYSTPEHFGTHLDAPIHSADHQRSADQLEAKDLFGPAVVIDVAAKCKADADYVLTVADVTAWEKDHGQIPNGGIVIM